MEKPFSKVVIAWGAETDPGIFNRMARKSESVGECNIGLDLATALDGADCPRRLCVLAEAAATIDYDLSDFSDTVAAAETNFIEAAEHLIQAFADYDAKREAIVGNAELN